MAGPTVQKESIKNSVILNYCECTVWYKSKVQLECHSNEEYNLTWIWNDKKLNICVYLTVDVPIFRLFYFFITLTFKAFGKTCCFKKYVTHWKRDIYLFITTNDKYSQATEWTANSQTWSKIHLDLENLFFSPVSFCILHTVLPFLVRFRRQFEAASVTVTEIAFMKMETDFFCLNFDITTYKRTHDHRGKCSYLWL